MSMPSFPPNGADMTREEALTMIIASIAMEELALSHILNAEGEKLQFILGTLPGTTGPCACSQDVLAVNKSVTALVEAVSQNQMLLKNKLDRVLEFCPQPPACGPGTCPAPCPPPCRPDPCPPPCPPPCPAACTFPHISPCKPRSCEKKALQLIGQREGMLWSPGCRLPWRQQICLENGIRWDERASTQIQLDPRKTYVVQYTLNACAALPAEGNGTIFLRQSPCGVFTDALPLHVSLKELTHGTQTLQSLCVLHPRTSGGYEVGLSLVLDAKIPLCVERAVIDIIELC